MPIFHELNGIFAALSEEVQAKHIAKMDGDGKSTLEAAFMELFKKHSKDGILSKADFMAMSKEQMLKDIGECGGTADGGDQLLEKEFKLYN